jgi:hypothetical protein
MPLPLLSPPSRHPSSAFSLLSSVICHPSSVFFLSPKILAGKNKIALKSESIASAAIPTIRNGIDNNHTIGHNASANNAQNYVCLPGQADASLL